jgi:integrase
MGVKVRERPKDSGDWWVFIDHQGDRKAKKIGRDKRLAIEVAKKIEAKLILGEMNLEKPDNKAPKFVEYAKTWIDVTVPATCKPSTVSSYKGLLDNHILPQFGPKPVNEINRLMVKNFLMGKYKSGHASSTVGHMKSAISGVLNLAVDDEVIPANPTHRIGKIFRVKHIQDNINPLDREELSILLETFVAHFPNHYPLALLLARTGMRLGEAVALKWADIDFHGRFINVERGFSRGKIETPKSGKSRRVDMSKQLANVLSELKHRRKIETVKKGWKKMPEWVFVSSLGTSLDINNWRRRIFDKALEKAGLRKVRIHDLRHTFASLLIQAGESLVYVRDQLGHHSIRVTVDIYGHLAPGGNKAAVDRLDDPGFSATIRNPSATNEKRATALMP